MNLQSVMQHSFSMVPKAEIQRSSFDRSYGHKTTFDAGLLIPIYVDEVLPGDTFNLNLTAFGRLATPIKPLMDNMYLESFYFFVPNRLVWTNFVKFMGEQTDPGDSVSYTLPQMVSTASTGYLEDSLHDHFGLPIGVPGYTHTSLPHRCYNLIYNEWFRDQNLQDSVVVDKDDGPDLPADYVILRRGKRHDYFTSCLPWPQKGTAVPVPLAGTAPITISGTNAPALTRRADTGALFQSVATYGSDGTGHLEDSGAGSQEIFIDPNGTLVATLSGATGATINQLRQAFQIQRMYERDARGGTRYTELVRAHFNVISPDARLQRPEYLGGGSTRINVTAVPQTSVTAGTPQGNLAGFGTVGLRGHGFTKSFTEHGYIIGMVCVRADLTYQRGLDRMWSRLTRPDFYFPALAHIGEQAVLSKEIYLDGTGDDDLVFGYQERFAEYRYKPSQITGLYRSAASLSLDYWHLSQDFASTRPLLNAAFIVEDPPIDRVIAVPSEPHFLFDSYTMLKCARPMPVFGVPGLIDHF